MGLDDVALDGGDLRELTADDLDDVQALFERCADYFVLHDERPPSATAARDEWDAVPDGTPRAAKRVLGLFAPRLAGVVEIVRGWPRAGTWNIGLLLLEPAARGRRVGEQIVQAVEACAAGAGADRLRISVIPANARGMAFWRRLGFEPVAAVGAHPAAIALERRIAS